MLKMQSVKYSYGNYEVLQGIDLEVKRGELFGLLGANGAGKTTLISILNGLLRGFDGSIVIDGKDLQTNLQQIQKISSFVPQSLAFYPNLSAKENLEFFGALYGLKSKDLHQKIDQAIEMTALQKVAHKRAYQYSGGLKRRLNIAIGLLNNPQILYLDEPTVGIDPQSRNYILQMIKQINSEKNCTVIYTSHYMEEVEFLCDRVVIIDGGKVVKNLNKAEFSNAAKLEALFLNVTDAKLRD